MTDRLALQLSEYWAIYFDTNQWIVCKARNLRSERKWQPVAYIGGRKATLERLTKENGVPVTAHAQVVMDTWPDTFRAWQRQQDRRAA